MSNGQISSSAGRNGSSGTGTLKILPLKQLSYRYRIRLKASNITKRKQIPLFKSQSFNKDDKNMVYFTVRYKSNTLQI
jgi:hypothetical protein